MALKVNGTTIPNRGEVYVNGTKPNKIKVNGTVVWEGYNQELTIGNNATYWGYDRDSYGSLNPVFSSSLNSNILQIFGAQVLGDENRVTLIEAIPAGVTAIKITTDDFTLTLPKSSGDNYKFISNGTELKDYFSSKGIGTKVKLILEFIN